MDRIARTIATEFNARPEQVNAAVKLLDEGATVPFVARYRKEVTGGLVHVSQLADRFVKDPHEVDKAGQVERVHVVEADVPRKRIRLSMHKDGGASARQDRAPKGPNTRGKNSSAQQTQCAKYGKNAQDSASGDAIRNALKNQ